MGTTIKSQGDWTTDIVTEANAPLNEIVSSPGSPLRGNSGIPAFDRTIDAIGEVSRAIDSVSSAVNSIGRIFQ